MYRILWPFRHPRLILIVLAVTASVVVPLVHKPKTASADTYTQTFSSDNNTMQGDAGGYGCGGTCGWVSPWASLTDDPKPLELHAGATPTAGGGKPAGVTDNQWNYDGQYFGYRKKINASEPLKDYCWPHTSDTGPGNCADDAQNSGYISPSYDAKWIPRASYWSGYPGSDYPSSGNNSGWSHPSAGGGSGVGASFICANGCSDNASPGGGYILYHRTFSFVKPRSLINDVTLRYQGNPWAGAVLDHGSYFPACKSGQLENGFKMSYNNQTKPDSENNWIHQEGNCQNSGPNTGIYSQSLLGTTPLVQLQSYDSNNGADHIAFEAIGKRNATSHPAFAYTLAITYVDPSCTISPDSPPTSPPGWRIGDSITITLHGAHYSQYNNISTGDGGNSVSDGPGTLRVPMTNFNGDYSFQVSYSTSGTKTITAKQLSSNDPHYDLTDVPPCPGITIYPPPLASCSASATPASPYIGHGVTITVSLKNETAAGGQDFNGYHLWQTTDEHPPESKSSPGVDDLSRGSSTDLSYADAARGSPGPPPVTFYYWLVDGSGNRVDGGVNGVRTTDGNPLCSTTATWRQLPVKPYFKAYGGDVFVGGAFDKKDSPCSNSASDYQTPTFGDISTYSKGGIYAFANSQIGASSEYAGFALGDINGSTDTDRSDDVLQYGFYTSGITMPIKQRQNTLSFANKLPSVVGSDSTYWGGYFEGSVKQLHCVTDYFYTKKSASAPTVPSVNLATITNGQYLINTSTTTSTPISGNISANPDNNRITIFVKGNVYISGNITYPACTIASCYGSGSAPKFALIVQGNIYIDPSVSRLDGLYIAQPDQTNLANTGVIWTCHDGSSGAYTSSEVISNCRNKLTFNGAVIAKQMNLWRTNDGINSDLPTNQTGTQTIPAEEFNYTPEMVIGNPFFNQSNGSQDYTVDSVITLPPVY